MLRILLASLCAWFGLACSPLNSPGKGLELTPEVLLPAPQADGSIHILQERYRGDDSVRFQISISNSALADSFQLQILDDQSHRIAASPWTSEAIVEWIWVSPVLREGEHELRLLSMESGELRRAHSWELLVEVQVGFRFQNETDRDATLFISGHTLITAPHSMTDRLILEGSHHAFSLNIEDWPPYPYFSEEPLHLSGNDRLELHRLADSSGFYYLLVP